MSHNKFDQFKALVTRFAAADGTLEAERSQAILDTELAREVLEAIAAGMMNPYGVGGPYGSEASYSGYIYQGSPLGG